MLPCKAISCPKRAVLRLPDTSSLVHRSASGSRSMAAFHQSTLEWANPKTEHHNRKPGRATTPLGRYGQGHDGNEGSERQDYQARLALLQAAIKKVREARASDRDLLFGD